STWAMQGLSRDEGPQRTAFGRERRRGHVAEILAVGLERGRSVRLDPQLVLVVGAEDPPWMDGPRPDEGRERERETNRADRDRRGQVEAALEAGARRGMERHT